MIQNGLFARFNGNEYRYEEDDEGNGFIYTENPDLIDKSFYDEEGDGIFERTVKPNDLEMVYEVNTIGIISGGEVSVIKGKEGKLLIGTSDPSLARELGLRRSDKYYYEGWINENDVELHKVVRTLQ